MEYEVQEIPDIIGDNTVIRMETEKASAIAILDFRVFVQICLLSSFVLLLLSQWRRKPIKKEAESANLAVANSRIKMAYYYFPSLNIPGLRLFEAGITLYKLRYEGVKFLESVVNKWGNLVSLGLGFDNVICVTDPNIVQKILSSSDLSYFNKPRQLYDIIFVEFLRDGIASSEIEIWEPHRKILNRSFTYKSLCTYIKIMNRHSQNLAMDLLKSSRLPGKKKPNEFRGIQGECVATEDVYNFVFIHVIKIISEITMGSLCCTDDEATAFHHTVTSWKGLVSHRSLNVHLQLWPIWKFHPLKKEYDRLHKECVDFMNKVIKFYRAQKAQEIEEETKIQENLEKHEIISNDANDDEDEDDGVEKPFRCLVDEMIRTELTDEEIRNEFGTIMLAGHESVALAIKILMFHIAYNQDAQALCRKEVDGIFERKQLNEISNPDLTMEDLTNLKVLERCVLESLRLCPAFPMIARRLDKPLRVDDDFELEQGLKLVMLPWCMHRDPEHWPDPEKFDPDRFLPENTKKRHPYAYIPFSKGTRNCIGWKLAIMEMKVILAWMLRHFELHTSDRPDDVKMLFEVTILPERDYNITMKKRPGINTTFTK